MEPTKVGWPVRETSRECFGISIGEPLANWKLNWSQVFGAMELILRKLFGGIVSILLCFQFAVKASKILWLGWKWEWVCGSYRPRCWIGLDGACFYSETFYPVVLKPGWPFASTTSRASSQCVAELEAGFNSRTQLLLHFAQVDSASRCCTEGWMKHQPREFLHH